MKRKEKKVIAFEVCDISTGNVVHTVTVSTGSNLDRLERGLLAKTDTDRFFVREKFK